MFLEKKFKSLIKLYILFLTIVSIFYLSALNQVATYNAMAEWVVNYQGGFVRRGLIGEIIFQLSGFFELNLRFVFFILQSFLYLLFYFLIYDLLKKLKLNYFILLAIFSPIFIIFPIAELEAIGRKEVLIFIILLISINLYFKYLNNHIIIFFISLSFPILILTFEASIFYSFFFISLILITSHKINLSYFLKLLLYSVPSIISIYLIYTYPHSQEETTAMCDALRKAGEECGMPTFFLSHTIDFHMNEVNWKLTHIFRYIMIFILGFSPLFYLVINSKFNEKLINPIFLKFPLFVNLIIMILPTLLMYSIAVDSGRWTHIVYSCTFIYYFGLLKNKAVILNDKLFNFNFENKSVSNFLKILLFILVCLSWNPKAVYHEDLGSIPIYRAIEKIPGYFNNFEEFKVFRENN